ncbi:MAG: DSD1 family PLP-dependent enzyme [Candidatus Rokubacteria bacterium]|nr:DSD1 family PLP-dependent enzyme [Candidatus Rokubacteria bacterium]MBI2526551.1 DSD1 family PLP-dependent enzyme [Candidatus Rokubacteria bacterium]
MTRADLPTPALLLDLDRFERNVQKMAAHVKAAGKRLRPHAKTHRCPEIARRQVAAGAVGVCVAKVGEAEVMAAAGVRNLLITTEVVGAEKVGRLLRVLERQPETMVVVDHPDNVRELGQAMARAGRVLNVLVDVEVGGRRTGVEDGEPALDLGRLVTTERALNLRGLQGYAGHCAHVVGWESRRRASLKWMRRLMRTRALFEKQGLPVEIVSGGSSGSFDIDVELPGLTELQAGSYCVMDLDYRRIGSRGGKVYDSFEMALTVLATVVSRPSAELAIVDAGFKAFSTDKPFPPEAVECPGLAYSWAGDEHGRLTIADQDRAPRLGDLLEFFPPHCDPTINLYDRIHAMRGDRVEAVWEISARGRSQ